MLNVLLIYYPVVTEVTWYKCREVCLNKHFWGFSTELITLLFSSQMFWNSRCRRVTSVVQGNIPGGRNDAAERKEFKMGQLEVSSAFEQVQ